MTVAKERLLPESTVDAGLTGRHSTAPNSSPPALASAPGRAADALWRSLASSALLLAVAGLTLFFVLVALVLPQMPGQLHDNPAEAARWLRSVAAGYGVLGELLRGLGLFSFLHSSLLKALLTLLALLLLVSAADQVGAWLTLRRLPALLHAPVEEAGDALPIRLARPLYRMRTTVTGAPETAADALAGRLAQRFGDLRMQPPPGGAAVSVERRVLARRDVRAAALRVLLPVGLLLAVAAAWAVVFFGWEAATPSLAPGGAFRHSPRRLEIVYVIPEAAAGEMLAPRLEVSAGGKQGELPARAAATTTVGGAQISVGAGSPALMVRTASGAPLVRPGDAIPAPAIGLLFPAGGSEESVILPEQGLGLRIVRLADSADAFLVEVYDTQSAMPGQTLQVRGAGPSLVQLTQTGEQIEFIPASGVAVAARFAPGLWLAWLGLPLAAAGLAGFARRPGFSLVQVARWSPRQAVVVAQSDLRAEMEQMADWCVALSERSDA